MGFSAWAVINSYRINNNRQNLTFGEAIRSLTDEICKIKTPINKQEMQNALLIDIPEINDYIKSVMVRPRAENWIVELVESICKRTGLTFLGKSKMHEGTQQHEQKNNPDDCLIKSAQPGSFSTMLNLPGRVLFCCLIYKKKSHPGIVSNPEWDFGSMGRI